MTCKTVPGWAALCCAYALAPVSLHKLTGKQAEKPDPSKVPLRANTVGHTLKKCHACWLTGQPKLLPIAASTPFIALYSHKQGTGMSCRQPHGSSLKLATRTVTQRHDCFWCRQSTLISYSDQLLRSSRKFSEPDLYYPHFSLLVLQISASYQKIWSLLLCTWQYCVSHQFLLYCNVFSWTLINLPVQWKRRKITTK